MPEASVVLGDACIPVGRLIFEKDGRRSHSTFIYGEEWLESPMGFDLAPDMPRGRTPFHSSAEGRESRRRDVMAGPFTDTSPDSWGRKLIRGAHGEGATEFDYLVAANDKARHGALRFLNEEGKLFHSYQPPVPRLANIEELRAITARYERHPARQEHDPSA